MFSKEKTIVPYTLERCNLCKTEYKRNFKEGDFLFSSTNKCHSCDGMMIVEKIFGEPLEK
ncbi:MAG: hypothetical protein COW27_02620 [Nitrosopumilales archaeon CG15_BIG_FIL_POST_REV_8_21_14_020_37_12]|nr:MAG: hypothetical protein COW27_02620 [Nitrosopumilales archaeon CG15_BIG_FIL_POST_REV_8_21_14_020_37_12]